MADSVAFSAYAAVGGSLVGATASVLSSYLLQAGTTRREFLHRSIQARQKLYAHFIKDAAELYSDAMANSNGDLTRVINLYATISRMRLVASQQVVSAAIDVITAILHRYGQSNVTLVELQSNAIARAADPLAGFSQACRHELEKVITLGS